MSAHCAAERRPQGTIRQRRIFGIGDASPRCRRRLGCAVALKPAEEASSSRSKSAAAVPDVNAPSRTVRPPFRLFDPFSAGLDQFQPTAFKAPVRTSVATEFNPGEHEYDTIPARHPSIRARGNFMLKRKAPFAVLVALGRVGKATRRQAPLPSSPRQPHSPLPSICAYTRTHFISNTINSPTPSRTRTKRRQQGHTAQVSTS